MGSSRQIRNKSPLRKGLLAIAMSLGMSLLAHAADKIAEGTTVTVTIIVARHSGWVVPRQAVLRDDGGTYIFQVDGATAHRIDVKTGIETDDETEITGPFDPKKDAVVRGNYELQDGMNVRSPAPNPSK